MYDGEELIHVYTPCENPDGVKGFYCVLSGEFLDLDAFLAMVLEHLVNSEEITVKFGGRS